MTKLTSEAKAELQRMIDIGAKQMRAQGCCSVQRSICAYRGKNGSKCFIGALIDDKHYSKDLEGVSINSTSEGVLKALESSGYLLNSELLEALETAQYVLHDELEQAKDFPAAFEAALVSYCSDYELDYTAPGETL
jgi:hypothetical protein